MEDVNQCNVCNEHKNKNESFKIKNIEHTICMSCAQLAIQNQSI